MAKRVSLVVAAVILLLLALNFSGLFPTTHEVESTGRTMGTTWSVKYVTDESNEEEVLASMKQALVKVNQQMSTYIPDSELMLLNKAPVNEPIAVSPELFRLAEQAMKVSELSGGAYDITAGSLVNLWGFGSGKSFSGQAPAQIDEKAEPAFAKWLESGQVSVAPDPAAIAEALKKTGYKTLILNAKDRTITKTMPVFIDLSSIAKGYGVDEVAHALEAHGITRYMVEVGGEVRLRGKKPGNEPWRIAVREPVLENRIQTVITLNNKGIATSGDYLNYYEVDGVHFSHLIDARTGYPEKHRLASVAVVNDDTGIADAYATMFMVLGEKAGIKLAEEQGIDAYFIYHTDEGFETRTTGNFSSYILDK
ncbi:FAD:protein FMN transferase [Sansalvadorimonas verongulae]|uniref:FAD:protein FMN transferase n=1 Tax=Sansalvadorimonas verongulae TaxID=2172824 RepID=UPI0012BC5CDB|nr:FAD:protein FMN transferase [Sansalvadorimonas verongulae]MTI14295.1 FAD:protein FMN transferase [Sansalvadorimonas verongulae]